MAKNAYFAQKGACNPYPLLNAVKEGIDELRDSNGYTGTEHALKDPALRLIVHQLAWLFKSAKMDAPDQPDYQECVKEVNQILRQSGSSFGL
ncbi:hypothetical protein [Parendozoicomonas haliclonae]|nr:hypothetical protein [Parendozoicomonas haliclonae]